MNLHDGSDVMYVCVWLSWLLLESRAVFCGGSGLYIGVLYCEHWNVIPSLHLSVTCNFNQNLGNFVFYDHVIPWTEECYVVPWSDAAQSDIHLSVRKCVLFSYKTDFAQWLPLTLMHWNAVCGYDGKLPSSEREWQPWALRCYSDGKPWQIHYLILGRSRQQFHFAHVSWPTD